MDDLLFLAVGGNFGILFHFLSTLLSHKILCAWDMTESLVFSVTSPEELRIDAAWVESLPFPQWVITCLRFYCCNTDTFFSTAHRFWSKCFFWYSKAGSIKVIWLVERCLLSLIKNFAVQSYAFIAILYWHLIASMLLFVCKRGLFAVHMLRKIRTSLCKMDNRTMCHMSLGWRLGLQ